ncbi:GntR family transcriptional regulator [Vallicoccus soli]|uniref:GntR family transcriptional regulator n=1 Tax=Vallicoccus soli TaxID=2339232 RepID=A0A3A3Z4A0_9ACTN|nr:GntR family transcriptional regulator [Vallicoccus soli]RJK97758.1 GntR family transcriptional regulator [Vallicoccus soli]
MGTAQAPAADRVYEHVRRAILDRDYAGGHLLTEGEVAEAVGVSRTPVREALLRLEAQGMLRLYPKRGALVLAVSAEEADDLFEAREVVEGFCARRAWERRGALLPRLEELLERMRAHRAAGDARALSEQDRAFHAAVVEAAGNAVFTRLYDSLRDRQTVLGEAAVHASPERMDRVVEEHDALLAALRGDDPHVFEELVRHHVESAADNLRRSR